MIKKLGYRAPMGISFALTLNPFSYILNIFLLDRYFQVDHKFGRDAEITLFVDLKLFSSRKYFRNWASVRIEKFWYEDSEIMRFNLFRHLEVKK